MDHIQRDKVLRAYFEGRDWDENGEFALKRHLVRKSGELLPDYPFVVDDEWEVQAGRSQDGVGDLVFTDGTGRFAVVEVKYVVGGAGGGSSKSTRRARTRKRQKVKEQALDYAAHWRMRLGVDHVVSAFMFTNEDDFPVPV